MRGAAERGSLIWYWNSWNSVSGLLRTEKSWVSRQELNSSLDFFSTFSRVWIWVLENGTNTPTGSATSGKSTRPPATRGFPSLMTILLETTDICPWMSFHLYLKGSRRTETRSTHGLNPKYDFDGLKNFNKRLETHQRWPRSLVHVLNGVFPNLQRGRIVQ